ncbi:lipocalin family protein [Caulobacter endophyticus]|uniref:lipocalin family protein n=1 Tax=Caulobacter endophyticus TaxID=2172652 RepID=UPI00240F5004|nr:lipocalin family protein [Caulobacter endophyticus]MDG2531799.1 lipocalin family protein [Caulobacter endophyticus]
MRVSLILSLAASLAVTSVATLPSAALAGAQPPSKPVAAAFYSGKWYEIARTPNSGQRNCEAPTTEFTAKSADSFSVRQICRRDSATGKAKTFNTKGKIVAGSENAKFSMNFLGGLKKQEYWVLDHADDASWAIMATPGGNFVWLLARKPVMDEGAKAAALARVKALGYEKLVFPQQPEA